MEAVSLLSPVKPTAQSHSFLNAHFEGFGLSCRKEGKGGSWGDCQVSGNGRWSEMHESVYKGTWSGIQMRMLFFAPLTYSLIEIIFNIFLVLSIKYLKNYFPKQYILEWSGNQYAEHFFFCLERKNKTVLFQNSLAINPLRRLSFTLPAYELSSSLG